MNYYDLTKELKLDGKVIAITRANNIEADPIIKGGCTLRALNRVFEGEKFVICESETGCKGANTGFGFKDGIPDMPGGFTNFICKGAGPGYPAGERLKSTQELAEKMILNQPQNVMEGFSAIELKLYEENDNPDLVTILVNADQLSALIHLFNYNKCDYESVIMPMVSGCASIFRVGFGELKRENTRAIIGNADVFSRPHFDKDTFFFTVTGRDFKEMISIAGESVLVAPIWNGVKRRL